MVLVGDPWLTFHQSILRLRRPVLGLCVVPFGLVLGRNVSP